MEIKELYKKFLKAKGVDPKLRNLVAGKKIDVSKKGLWDKNRKQVIVPSNRITMKGPNGEQDFFKKPVIATGLQSGQRVMMQPGGEYYFPNDKAVHEVRMEEGGIIQPFLKMQEGAVVESTDKEVVQRPISEYKKQFEDEIKDLPSWYERNRAKIKSTVPSEYLQSPDRPFYFPKIYPTFNEEDNPSPSAQGVPNYYKALYEKGLDNRINISSKPENTEISKVENDPSTIMSHEIGHYLNHNNPEVFLHNRIKLAEAGINKTYGYKNFYTNELKENFSDERKSNEFISDAYALKQDMRNKGYYDYTKGEKLTPEIWEKYKQNHGNTFNAQRFNKVFKNENDVLEIPTQIFSWTDSFKDPKHFTTETELGNALTYLPKKDSPLYLKDKEFWDKKEENLKQYPDYIKNNRRKEFYVAEAENLSPDLTRKPSPKIKSKFQDNITFPSENWFDENVNNKSKDLTEQWKETSRANPLYKSSDEKMINFLNEIVKNNSNTNRYSAQDGGSIQTDITSPIRQKASTTQDAFNAMLAQYETNKATPETDASSPEDMGFQLGGDVPVVIDSLFSNFAKGLGKKYAQMGMNNVGIPEDETPIRPSDLPSLPQDAGKFNQLLYNKADSRQKRLQAEFDVKEAADKEIRYVNNPKYADLLTAEFYGPEKTYDDLNEEESAKINDILTNRRTNLKNINLVSADLTKKGIKAGYDPNLHTMYVPQIPTDRGVHSHEFSHVGDQALFDESTNPGVGTYFTEQINKGMYPKESLEFLNQPSSLKLNQTIGGNREQDFNEADYLQDPSEVKARLRALRDSSIQQGYKLLEPGYDIKKYNKGFNKEEKKQYDQLKSSGLSDDKINELMYLFAKNNTPQSVMAQKGAFIPYQSPRPFLRTSPAGLAGYSDNTRVVTPESNLTDADRERITQIELAKRRGTISQGKKETAYEKAKRKSSFVEQEKERTGSASPISYVIDAVNPANVAFSAVDLVGNTGSAIKNTAKGNFSEAGNDLLQAGVNALGVLPAASQLKNIAKPLSKLARISPSQYKSIPTINNFSKFDELTPQSMDDIYHRVVNNPGYSDDVQEAIDYWQEYTHASPALDKSFTLELGEDLPLTRRLKTPLTFDESGYVINSGKPTAFSAGLGNDVLGQHRVHLMAPKGTKVSPISRAASSTTMQGEREVLFPTTSKFKKLHSRVNPQTGLEDYIIGLEMKKGGVVQMQKGGGKTPSKKKAKYTSDNPEYTYDQKGNLYYKSKNVEAPQVEKIKLNKLNPTVGEVAETMGSNAPIDATYKNSENKLVMPPSRFLNQLTDDYIKPNVIGKKFGEIEQNTGNFLDEGYSKNRTWVSNPLESIETTMKYLDGPNLNAYFLKPNKTIPGYTDVKNTDTLGYVNEEQASNPGKELVPREPGSEKYKQYNNWFTPYNTWNRSRQMAVEMQNNPEIKEWAKLHNIDLSSKPRTSEEASRETQSGEYFAPKLAEQINANRGIKAGDDIVGPPLSNNYNTRIIQNPNAFDLVGYGDKDKINKFTAKYKKENNINGPYESIPYEKQAEYKQRLFKELGIDADPNEVYMHLNRSPLNEYTSGMKNGGTASESVTCSNCGHSWKISEGGLNTLSCHKCGGNAKMQMGGMSIPGVNGSVVSNTNAPSLYKKYKKK